MSKPSYEDLERRVQELENEVQDLKLVKQALGGTGGNVDSFLDELKDGFFVTDINGKVIHVNKALSEMFGYESPGDAVGNHFSEYLPKDVNEEVGEKFNRAISDINYEELLEIPALKKDGSTVFVQLKHSPVMEGEKVVGTKGMIRDITPRKRTEEALKESEKRMKALLDSITETAIMVDLDGTIQAVNKTAAKRFGGTVKSITGRNVWDFMPADVVRKRIAKRDEVFRKGVSLRFEDVRDGEIYDSNLSPIHDENGKITAFAVFSMQITEQKKALTALRESEERYRSLFEDNQMVVFLVDPDTGKIVEGNSAACSFYGYSKEQLTRLRITDINTLPDEELRKLVEEIMSKTQGRFFFTHRLASREIRNVESFVGPIVVNGKQLLYSMVHDITERVQAEKAFWESQERYRLLIKSMNDGFAILDKNDLFSFVNDKFLDMLGCLLDEVIESHADRFLDQKNQKIVKKHLKALKTGGRVFYEVFWTKKDGGEVPTIMSATPIIDEEGLYKGSFAVITDITELKKTEQDLIESRNELKDRTRNLEEVNAALRVLLEQREKDKTEIEEQVMFNMQELIMPYLEDLKESGLNEKQNDQLSILESNLNEIISPFARRLSAKFLSLTPTEVQVANLIRQGRTTKVIAHTLRLSSKTIEEHRKNIRKKLGIKNRKTNLRSHLLTIQ